MKLTRPIRSDAATLKPTTDEKKIEALIEKGGSSVATKQTVVDDDERQQLRLVAYTSQLREIEGVLKLTPKRGRLSRHAWILQAIDEKLERAKKKLK